MLKKLMVFLHSKATQFAASGGILFGAWLYKQGYVSEAASMEVAGAATVIFSVVAKEIVVWVATKFIKDKQVIEGIKADGYAGPATREATNTPKL